MNGNAEWYELEQMRIAAVEDLKRAYWRMRGLQTASDAIETHQEWEATLNRLAEIHDQLRALETDNELE